MKRTTQPMRTATEVVNSIRNSRLSKRMETASAAASEETLEGSTLPLIMADMRSKGEILMEEGEGCMVVGSEIKH